MALTVRNEVELVARAQVNGLTDPAARSIAAVQDAIAAYDVPRAATLLLARAVHGEDVPAELVAAMLPHVTDAVLAVRLIAVATGDRAAAWLDAVRACRRVPGALSLACVALYAAWRAGAPRDALIREARRLSVKPAVATMVHVDAVARAVDDRALSEAVAPLSPVAQSDLGKAVIAVTDTFMSMSAAEHVAALPEALAPAVSGYTVRLAPRVGRNDACPCGSGQKFKRCCIDKAPSAAPSPVAGLSWDEYLARAAQHLSAEDVLALSLRDLARVDVTALGEHALLNVVRRWAEVCEWERAERAVEELARRGSPHADGCREDLIYDALCAGALDVARRQLADLPAEPDGDILRHELALRSHDPGALDAYQALVAQILDEGRGSRLVELACSLLRAAPALGILVARGCLRDCHVLDAETLCETIEEARGELGLPSGDVAWDVYATLEHSPDDDDEEAGDAAPDDEAAVRTAREMDELRAALRASATRADELGRQLAATQQELEAAREAPAPVAPGLPDADERERVRRLRTKVEELQRRVRESNGERRELRRQLAGARAAAADAPSSPAPARAPDDDAGDPVAPVERGIAMPVLTRRAQDALRSVPEAAAAEALRTIGALAAGDAAPWRRVKQAQDLRPPLFMARVGLHHRLLFRVAERTMEIVDVVTRENLLVTLKQLRSHRG